MERLLLRLSMYTENFKKSKRNSKKYKLRMTEKMDDAARIIYPSAAYIIQ